MTREQELEHRLAMVADDLKVFRKFAEAQGFDLTKPTTHADMACIHLNNIEIACDLSDNESLNWVPYNATAINEIIEKLKAIDIDGENMQFILEKVGMQKQMHRQLVMTMPIYETEDFLEERKDL
jgi:hypothetical protein